MHNQQSSFKFFREEPGYSGLRRRLTPFSDQQGGLEEIVVQQSRLDSVLPDSTGISFIKIDIEGGEKDLFAENYEKWLSEVKVLIIELHDRKRSGTSRAVYNALTKYPFDQAVSGYNTIFYNMAFFDSEQ